MVRIEIFLDENVYLPAQAVKGRVSVKTHEPLSATLLRIRFLKSQKVFLKEIRESEPKVLIDKEQVAIDREFMIAETICLSSGITIFPFRMYLRLSENGSGQLRGHFYDMMCQIQNNYSLEVQCCIGSQVVCAEKSLVILDRNEEKQFIDSRIRIGSFMCLMTKSIQFRIQTDREWYFGGDTVQIDCFLTSKTNKSLISGVDANLHEIVIFNRDTESILRTKIMSSFQAYPLGKNHFRIKFRLPTTIATMTERDFVVRTAAFFTVKFYNGSSMKIKKYINVAQISLEIPEIDSALYYETNTYCEQVFNC